MSYCEGNCEHLTTRHNCKKYGKRLGYSKVTVCGNVFSSSHERCSECDKDHWITEFEEREKRLHELVDRMLKVSDRLCPEEEPDHSEDGEEIFEHGRGQGIFEMCTEVKHIINP